MRSSTITTRVKILTGLFAAILSRGMAQTAGSTATPGTATPIRHLVVIFQENVSFDH